MFTFDPESSIKYLKLVDRLKISINTAAPEFALRMYAVSIFRRCQISRNKIFISKKRCR